MKGKVEAIFIAGDLRGEQRPLAHAQLVASSGIVGDRYFGKGEGGAGQNVTLVEAEEIERYNRDHQQHIGMNGTRRNIVTRGIRLNSLVGKEFTVGGVRLRGMELCEPCKFLGQNLATQEFTVAEVVAALVHKAGLRADVLSSGGIAVGDPVAAPDDS